MEDFDRNPGYFRNATPGRYHPRPSRWADVHIKDICLIKFNQRFNG